MDFWPKPDHGYMGTPSLWQLLLCMLEPEICVAFSWWMKCRDWDLLIGCVFGPVSQWGTGHPPSDRPTLCWDSVRYARWPVHYWLLHRFRTPDPDLHGPQLGMWNIFTGEYSKRERHILYKMTKKKKKCLYIHPNLDFSSWNMFRIRNWIFLDFKTKKKIWRQQFHSALGIHRCHSDRFLQQMANIYLLHLYLFVSTFVYFFQSKMCFYFLIIFCFSPLNS